LAIWIYLYQFFITKVGVFMIDFDERFHLHVGYYENNCDYEATFYKVLDEHQWFMFFENVFYKINLLKDYSYHEGYGLLIGKNDAKEISYDDGVSLWIDFLKDNNIVS
jgi:Protein of unknown function (DUF3986)